jgi:hypothetical protein
MVYGVVVYPIRMEIATSLDVSSTSRLHRFVSPLLPSSASMNSTWNSLLVDHVEPAPDPNAPGPPLTTSAFWRPGTSSR